MSLRPRRALGHVRPEKQEDKSYPARAWGSGPGLGLISNILPQGSQESAKLVISETEILEEDEEPKDAEAEAEAEAGSQTDIPTAEVQYSIALHPSPSHSSCG